MCFILDFEYTAGRDLPLIEVSTVIPPVGVRK